MSFALSLIIFLLLVGLAMGSFVNAAVWRIHEDKALSLLSDRSECVHCHHKLAWYDLVPVISWLTLRGKCRYCGKRIDDTPLPEIGVALYFVLSYLWWPHALSNPVSIFDFVMWLIYGVILAILFVYDARWMRLPSLLLYLLIVLSALQLLVDALAAGSGLGVLLLNAGYGVLLLGGLYFALYVVSHEQWVGKGDAILGIFFGLALHDWKLALLTLFLANLLGCLYIIPGLIMRRLKRTSRVPFGPFLILGFTISMLVGTPLVNWYIQTVIG